MNSKVTVDQKYLLTIGYDMTKALGLMDHKQLDLFEKQKLNIQFPIRPYLVADFAKVLLKKAQDAADKRNLKKCEFLIGMAEREIEDLEQYVKNSN